MARIVQQGCCAGCSTPYLVYIWWAINTVISITFAALAIVNSRHIAVTFVYSSDQSDANLGKAGILVACILGAIMVLTYCLISSLILAGNMWSRKPLQGFWYGQLLSSSLHVSMFMLLSALVLTTFNSTIDRATEYGSFPADWSAVYKVTFALAYVLVASYLLLFFLFWLCKSAFVDQQVATIIVESRTPSANAGGNATVAVIREKDVKNAKKAAKAAQKAMEFNKAFGGQAETIV